MPAQEDSLKTSTASAPTAASMPAPTPAAAHGAHAERSPWAEPPCLVCGSCVPELGEQIARLVDVPLIERRIERFPDGEMYVQLAQSVRGRDAYVLQSTSAPANDHLFELLLLLDTLHRASAARLTAVIPYYGYARQERKSSGREPITAKLVANLLVAAGADRIVSVDLHSPAIQGFFDIGMDHLTAVPLLADYLEPRIPRESVLVSPDTGGVKRVDLFASRLDLPIAILHKRRASAREVAIAAVVGDVRDKYPIIVDDIVATGGTIRQAVDTLIHEGARPEVRVVATHGVLAGDATRLLDHPAIREVIVTDTIPIPLSTRRSLPRLHVVSVADLLASAIQRLHHGHSLSEMFPRNGAPPV
ncbi:MAG TPA: ribose-phosphate diphosphokinase [Ktedonobacterales bacterium]|nr:ribose-phosphate diphosphokinase [Ktedonobacterales bacterium]